MKNRFVFIGRVFLVASFIRTSTAYAEDGATQGVCRADVQQFCGDVQPGGGRIAQCMKQHGNELSDGCKQNIAAMKDERKAKAQEFKNACGSDVQKFCADVPPGGGREVVCLKQHTSEVTGPCQQTLASMPMRRGKGPGAPPPPPSSQGSADKPAPPPPPPPPEK